MQEITNQSLWLFESDGFGWFNPDKDLMRYCKVNMMVFYFFDLLLLLLKILFNSVAWKLQKQLSNLNASKLLHRAIPIWYYMGCQYVQILFGINWWFFFPNVSFIIDVAISKIEIDLFTFTLYLSFSYLVMVPLRSSFFQIVSCTCTPF